MANAITLMWFRQDLRLRDNPALASACEQGKVVPVYIDDDENSHRGLGGASKWWLHHSLSSLSAALEGKLVVRRGNPFEELKHLAAEVGATHVVWNRCYEPWQIKRDTCLKAQLKSQGLTVNSFQGSLLWEPWTILTKMGTPYKVYTPFYRKGCCVAPSPRQMLAAPDLSNKLVSCGDLNPLEQIAELKLIPSIAWYQEMQALWQPGEEGASAHLSQFLEQPIHSYDSARDKPSVRGTSLLSPHLHFGEISPNQIWWAVLHKQDGPLDHNADRYLSEIAWREFSYYLLYHFPELPYKNFNPKFDNYPWQHDAAKLEAWQRGQTGVPIVDAGMRELWQTGYMHNRVRMIVASYLVKNLGVHWRHGEAWFWDCLLDADLAANAASWQWVAGSGADAAPFFRIFNPVLQGEKFDKQGVYVKRYCPELKDLPDKYIHQPWLAPEHILASADVELGENYPMPLVDLKASRVAALEGYEQVKQGRDIKADT